MNQNMNMNPQQIHQTGMMGNIQYSNMNVNQVNDPMEQTECKNPMSQNDVMNFNFNDMNSLNKMNLIQIKV